MKNKILRISVIMVFVFIFTLSGCTEKAIESESETKRLVKAADTETKIETKTETESEFQTELESETETAVDLKTVLADKNLTVCIDPGHYSGQNVLYFEDGTSYCEGDVTLLIAKELRTILLEEYGIHSVLTRETGTMTVNGLSNDELNGMDLELRGHMSEGCDLFVSIHTNANNDWANGYETCTQPIRINKPILIANKRACEDKQALEIGNRIGCRIAELYREKGLSQVNSFSENRDGHSLPEWSDVRNDELNAFGTIYVRTGDNGEDYYGVLRGAAYVSVPGFIIEHGFHTVPEVRKAVLEGSLIHEWAEADALGIAEGFAYTQE